MSTKQWNKCNSQRQAISICPNMHKSWALPLTLFFPDSAQVISSGTKLICLAAQSCLTLCEPINCSPPGSSVLGIFFPGKNTGVGCHFLLQEILPTQGSNPGLSHCREMLYHLSHQGTINRDFSCNMILKVSFKQLRPLIKNKKQT